MEFARPEPEQAKPKAEATRPGDTSEFHRIMKKMALFYCHAMDYAEQINKRVPFVTPEQQQACVSTLFIEGARRNLIDVVPARGDGTKAPEPKPSATREPQRDEPHQEERRQAPRGSPTDEQLENRGPRKGEEDFEPQDVPF